MNKVHLKLFAALTVLFACVIACGCSFGDDAATQEGSSRKIANNVEIQPQGDEVVDFKLGKKRAFNGVTMHVDKSWNVEKSEEGAKYPQMTCSVKKLGSDSQVSLIIKTYSHGETKDAETFTSYTPDYAGRNLTVATDAEWTEGGCAYRVISAFNAERKTYISYLIGSMDSGMGFSARFFLEGKFVNEGNLALRDAVFSRTSYDESQTDLALCSEPGMAQQHALR